MLNFDINVIWFSKESYMPGDILPLHRHEYYHYIYVLSGTGKIIIDGNEYMAQENVFFLTNKGISHSLQPQGKEGLRVIEIKFEINNEQFASSIHNMNQCIKMTSLDIRYKLEKLVHEGINKELYYEDIINAKFLEILIALLRFSNMKKKYTSLEFLMDENVLTVQKAHQEVFLSDVISYIKNNLDSQLNLDTLAKVAKMSKYHFCRIFKNKFKITPIQYINELRIERAKELMLHSDLNITQIAFNLGFNDVHYFSRVFKQKEKVTPLEYLKNYNPNLYFYINNESYDKIINHTIRLQEIY